MAEVVEGFINVAAAGGEAFVMVADFVAQVANFFDGGFVPALGHSPEVVGAGDVAFGLYFGKCQGVQGLVVHVVAQDDGFIGGVFEESGEGLKNKALVLQGSEEVAVCFEGEVQGWCFFRTRIPLMPCGQTRIGADFYRRLSALRSNRVDPRSVFLSKLFCCFFFLSLSKTFLLNSGFLPKLSKSPTSTEVLRR